MIASGREVPSKALLIMPGAGIAQKMSGLLPGVPHVIRDGVAVRASER